VWEVSRATGHSILYFISEYYLKINLSTFRTETNDENIHVLVQVVPPPMRLLAECLQGRRRPLLSQSVFSPFSRHRSRSLLDIIKKENLRNGTVRNNPIDIHLVTPFLLQVGSLTGTFSLSIGYGNKKREERGGVYAHLV